MLRVRKGNVVYIHIVYVTWLAGSFLTCMHEPEGSSAYVGECGHIRQLSTALVTLVMYNISGSLKSLLRLIISLYCLYINKG